MFLASHMTFPFQPLFYYLFLPLSLSHHSDAACRRPSDTATVSWLQSKVASADWSFTSYSAPTSVLQGLPPAGAGLLCKCSCVIRIYEQPNPHTVHHQGDRHPPTGWSPSISHQSFKELTDPRGRPQLLEIGDLNALSPLSFQTFFGLPTLLGQ
jgi:hypothetical protein